MKIYLALLNDVIGRLGWRFPVLVAWTALVGLTEGISVALLLPLLSRVGVAAASNQSAAMEMIEKGLSSIHAAGPVEILAIIIVFAAIQTALSISLNIWTGKLARCYQGQRQVELFRVFMHAKWTFVIGLKGGEMTNAIVTECERLGRAFTICLLLLASLVVTVIYVTLSWLITWQVTLSLIAIACAGGLAMAQLYKKSFAIGRSLAPLDAEFQSVLNEQFAGAKFIKASGGEDRAAARIEPLVRKLERANAIVSSMPGTVRGLLEFGALVSLATMLVLASKGMGVAPGNAVVVIALFARLFPRMTSVQAQVHYLNGNIHAIEAVNELQAAGEREAERRDQSEEALKLSAPTALTVRNLEVKFGKHVALDAVDLTLSIPGMLAIVGSSGAGKSTLVHTLLGLVEPTAGTIRLGTYQMAQAPLRSWRRTIGYVPQETILFHASITDNLTLVNPAASPSEIKVAVRRAHAEDFIDRLPEGFDTVIGDQGVKLSGGQRQRLGIARALLTNPILLVMDEAMSALDAESEAELMRTIEDLRKQMGILLVAHRLSTVRTADSICVMDAGRIVEQGSWNELIARRSRLHALAQAQSFEDPLPMARY